MSGPNVGKLTLPVTVQQLNEGTASSGFPTESWTTLHAAAWMSREAVRGTEQFKADGMSAAAIQRWTMRYVADMDPDLVDVPKTRRLVYQNRVYDITAADVMDRREWILLTTLANLEQTA